LKPNILIAEYRLIEQPSTEADAEWSQGPPFYLHFLWSQ